MTLRFPVLDGVFPAPDAQEVTAHDAGSRAMNHQAPPRKGVLQTASPPAVSAVLLTTMGRGAGTRAVSGWLGLAVTCWGSQVLKSSTFLATWPPGDSAQNPGGVHTTLSPCFATHRTASWPGVVCHIHCQIHSRGSAPRHIHRGQRLDVET